MITELTTTQVSKLKEYREEWLSIGLSTGPCVREDVEAAVDECYRCAGLTPPTSKIWVGSPLEGCKTAAQLSLVGDQVSGQIGDQVRGQIWAQIGDQIGAQVGAQVRAQVRDQVRAQIWDQVRLQIWGQVYQCGFGTHDSDWLAFCEYFCQEFFIEEIKQLSGLILLARAGCGWWWPFEDAVILSERPNRLIRDDEHRLHCDDGPALQYPDGFSVYAWHGVRLEPWMIENAERITPEVVLQQENQEIRRALLEIYGYPNSY